MLYQIIISLILAIWLLNMALNMRFLPVPRRNAAVPSSAPMISVLVPARNEENNIGDCLASLLQQDYPNFEILVLDDNSEDNTAEIVKRMAENDRRLRLLCGEPLPEGWAGKPHACIQAAREAEGDWLLFTDADTVHTPDALRRTLALAIETNASLLSGFPQQVTTSISQKLVIPMIYFIIMSWAPLWWLHRSTKPTASIAIGQFLLFSRKAYWDIGGHEAVKDRITEDLYLGVEIAKNGGRHLAADLSDVVSCRMYDSLGSIWGGLSRTLYGISSISSLALAAMVAIGFIFFVWPFFLLGILAFSHSYLPVWAPLVIFQVGMLLIMRQWADIRFKESFFSAVFFPLGMLLLIAIVINGMVRQLAGTGVSWKQRIYARRESAE